VCYFLWGCPIELRFTPDGVALLSTCVEGDLRRWSLSR
jgi:hypothetical protein